MSQTGPRVAWVVGARFETEAEAGADSPVAKFVREIGDEFLVRISPARFDDEMIREYLQVRPNAPSYTNEQINMVARFTTGPAAGGRLHGHPARSRASRSKRCAE